MGVPTFKAAGLLLITLAVRGADVSGSGEAVEKLRKHLALPLEQRPAIADQAFAKVPLTRPGAEEARTLLWDDHVTRIRASRAHEVQEKRLRDGELEMPFYYEVFGEKPVGGRSLFISMHGGGNAAARVNDRQWENQKRLYRPEEGVYLAPRAPTNTWNLWHEEHIDRMFGRLIENLIVFEDVNPNRVYIMGYSAGGDGVYQLAPRMADRWAAAAMMAGHPNETSPLGLRNIAFTIHVGALDRAYKRNDVAAEWGTKLAELRASDPDGYVHFVKLHADRPHWMNREDAEALPWMMQYTRNVLPRRVVWKQDDVLHERFYWLAVKAGEANAGDEVVARYAGQEVVVEKSDARRLIVRLDDRMVDLDRAVVVKVGGERVFEGAVKRSIGVMAATLKDRGDPEGVFAGEIEVEAAR